MTEIPSSEIGKDSNLLTVEMFEHLNLPETIPAYEGTGSTSFKKEHDGDKLAYMKSFGINLSSFALNEDGEITDRPLFGTAFKVFSDILVIEELKREGENISMILPAVNQKMIDKRVAKHGERILLNSGKRLSEYYVERGLSGNPELKVTMEELQMIVKEIIRELSK
jgi:hypothetical protein